MKRNDRLSKKILSLAVGAAVCMMSTVPAFAGTLTRNYNGAFSSAWERYAATSDGNGSLTYGYNPFLVNEDYAWAKHSKKSHYAALNNGAGWHTGPGKSAGAVSKIEVTHNGTSIAYYLYY